MSGNKLVILKSEVKSELVNNILPFWSEKMSDSENGGFYGRIEGNGHIHPTADKGCVLNSRILWTFSSAYRVLKNAEYLKVAEKSKDYLLKYFFDQEYNGVFWLIDHKGKMKEDKAGFWKCPYHNARMCLEIIERQNDQHIL
jgi:mannobiose 2-epimerase